MPDSDMISGDEAQERDLRIALMRADLDLKRQGFWEMPRNVIVIVGGIAAIVATIAGMAGYKFGANLANEQQPRPIIIQMVPSPPAR